MIINVPSFKYLLENINDDQVQIFIISLGVILKDSLEIDLENKTAKLKLFLELMQEGIEE